MKILVRALNVAVALVVLSTAHGGEFVLAVTTPAPAGSHDCGCSDGCACKGPSKGCNCSKKGVTLKNACGCGCSGNLHVMGGSAPKSLLACTCDLGAPVMIWTPLPDMARPQAWRLAFEHRHPPRALT